MFPVCDVRLTSCGKHGRVVEARAGAVDDNLDARHSLDEKCFVQIAELHRHGLAPHDVKPAKEKRAIDHGVHTPRLVLAPPGHLVVGKVLLPQYLELFKAKLESPLLGQVTVHGGRILKVLDALHEGDARLGELAHRGLHVAVRREGKLVLALLRRVRGENPAVVRAAPLRGVVDEGALVGGFEGSGKLLGDDGDAVAGLLEAEGGAEADDAGSEMGGFVSWWFGWRLEGAYPITMMSDMVL